MDEKERVEEETQERSSWLCLIDRVRLEPVVVSGLTPLEGRFTVLQFALLIWMQNDGYNLIKSDCFHNEEVTEVTEVSTCTIGMSSRIEI